MNGIAMSLEEAPRPEDVATIRDGLDDFNKERVPDHLYLQRFAVFLRDADDIVVGGLLGQIGWEWLHIGYVFVPDCLRGQGYGRSLVLGAEEYAIRSGCLHAHLDTFDFQARGFYEVLGYHEFARLEAFPRGHTRYFMRKGLGAQG